MKTTRIMKRVTVFLTAVCTVVSANILPVQAGLVEVVRDTSTVQDEINESIWHNVDGNVTAENGVIVFPNESTSETKLIAKTKAKVNEGVSEVASLTGKLQFTSLPQGEKFIIAFGLPTIESESEETGNVEIVFTNEGGLNVSVMAYPEDGEAEELLAARKCGSMNGTEVKAMLTADQAFTVSIGGTQVYSGTVPVSGEGRIGFLQTGSCGVKISDINIRSYDYDRPENCDIEEDFGDGAFNRNLLTSKLVYRSYSDWEPYLGITEIDGNEAFLFRYTNLSYLGTKYKYSNFEMTFDVPYWQRSNVLDEEGNTTVKATGQLIVTFGGEAAAFNDYGYDTATERLLFRELSAISVKSTGTQVSTKPVFPFGDPSYDKGFSIKIRMVDNVCTISMKWIDETEWIEVLSYRIQTPTGNIHIWGQGTSNYAIDNLKIVNLDENPNLIEVDYKSAVIEVVDDYDYQPTEKVYVEKEETEENDSLYWLIPVVAGVCVFAFGTAVAVVKLKNRKRKAGVSDEK